MSICPSTFVAAPNLIYFLIVFLSQTDMDSTNLYAYISIIALFVCIPPAIIVSLVLIFLSYILNNIFLQLVSLLVFFLCKTLYLYFWYRTCSFLECLTFSYLNFHSVTRVIPLSCCTRTFDQEITTCKEIEHSRSRNSWENEEKTIKQE